MKFTANTIVIYNPYEYAEKEAKRTYSNGDANIQGIELKKQKNDTDYKKCRVTYLDPITKEKIEFIPDGQPFREKMKQCKGVFRTGQYWLHCPNVIIQAGCTYEEGYVD